jgi:surface protein
MCYGSEFGVMPRWNVALVTDMSEAFSHNIYSSDKSTFNADISGWNTESVTTMKSMFSGASAFNQALAGRGLHSSTSHLNLSTLCGIRGAFRGCLGGI